jgi:hypothetical protein
MKITLKRKADVSDQDPLIVQYLEGGEDNQVKKSITVKVGETLDVDDDLAIEIMQRYKGLFSMGDTDAARVSPKTAAFAHRGKPQYADKAAQTGEG